MGFIFNHFLINMLHANYFSKKIPDVRQGAICIQPNKIKIFNRRRRDVLMRADTPRFQKAW